MVEDGDVSAYEAVRDLSSAVYVVALHDDGVLYLGVPDGGVVSAVLDANGCLSVVTPHLRGADTGCSFLVVGHFS